MSKGAGSKTEERIQLAEMRELLLDLPMPILRAEMRESTVEMRSWRTSLQMSKGINPPVDPDAGQRLENGRVAIRKEK